MSLLGADYCLNDFEKDPTYSTFNMVMQSSSSFIFHANAVLYAAVVVVVVVMAMSLLKITDGLT